MNKEIITKGLALLKYAYPNTFKNYTNEDTEMMIIVWLKHFKNDDPEKFATAINNLIKKSTYIPSIADVKREIAELTLSFIPKAEDEWNEVLKLVRKYGSYGEIQALNEMNEYTRYIVKHIGFRNICLAENQTWNKKEFIGEYNELKNKNIENLQIGYQNNLKMLEVQYEKNNRKNN